MKNKGNRKRLHQVIASLALAFFLSVGTYVFNNSPYNVRGWAEKLCFIENNIQKIFDKSSWLDDDAFFINVAYDRQVASYNDGLGPHGTVDITDRDAILRLLNRLEAADNYRFIYLGIRFEKGISTVSDSALFHKIAGMRDIVIAGHSNIMLADPILEPKAALSDYSSILNSSFIKYQFLQDGKKSVPLTIYENESGETIRKSRVPFIYVSNGRICYNSLPLRFPKEMTDQENGVEEISFYDLGPQLNEWVDDDALSDFVNDKFVFVGDFKNDVHGTSYGKQPGTYINYVAMEYLLDGRHFVNPWFNVIMFLIYAGLFYLAMNKIMAMPHIFCKHPFLGFLSTLATYTIILSIVTILVFICSKNIYNVSLPSVVFSSIDFIQSKLKQNEKTV